MDKLVDAITNENVTVSDANKNKFGKHETLNKDTVLTKINTAAQVNNNLKITNNMSFKERCDVLKKEKKIGDDNYLIKNFDAAAKQYLNALTFLNFEKLGLDEVDYIIENYQIPILLNLSTVYYEQNQLNKGIAILNEAGKLKHITKNPKFYYKYSIIYHKLKDYDTALEYINKSLQLSSNNLYSNKRKQILLDKRVYISKSKQLYSGMLKKELYNTKKVSKIVENNSKQLSYWQRIKAIILYLHGCYCSCLF